MTREIRKARRAVMQRTGRAELRAEVERLKVEAKIVPFYSK